MASPMDAQRSGQETGPLLLFHMQGMMGDVCMFSVLTSVKHLSGFIERNGDLKQLDFFGF